MKIGKKIKLYTQSFLAIFSVSLLVLSQIPSTVTIVHSEPSLKESSEKRKKEDDAKKSKFIKSIKDANYGSDLKGDLEKAKAGGFVYEKETVPQYVNYLLLPGFFMEDVNNYTKVDEDGVKTDSTVVHKKPNGRNTICFHDKEPQNLLNHNCNIPSFGTELFQQITKNFDSTGIHGSGKTSAYAGALGFGVPAGIPTGKVPIEPAQRTEKYTALELFGYDLHFTTYTGEYDSIMTSSEARLLANVGFFGKIKVGGAAILKGLGNVFHKWSSGWIFNPAKWGSKQPGFIDGVVSTVIDTSDYNVVAQHAWKRPDFSKTLYNVHYMSDKEVIEKAVEDFKKYIREELYKEVEKDPDAKEVLYLMPGGKHWPVFTYDPNVCVKKEIECTGKGEEKTCQEVCTQYETEEEQFKKWKNSSEIRAYDARAKKQGIDCYDKATRFSDVEACWPAPFDKYARKTLMHDNPVIQYALKAIERRYLKNNPYADPNRGLSHYICADEEGNPPGNDKTKWEYYYTKENTRDAEFVNKGCKLVRPSIDGAKFGTGDGQSTDGRYLFYTQNYKPNSVGFFGGLSRGLAKFSAKLTNTLLSLSYENIISYLSLDTVIETSFNTFRDSLFFPLSVIIIAISGFYILLQAVKAGGSAWKTAGILILTYILCSAILFNSGKILKVVESVPNKIDKMLMSIVLSSNDGASYCSGSGENSEIRHAQCAVWDITIFQPWVRGQFGASYKELDDDKMEHTNRDLVGSPDVDMGGKHIEKNWALWQLSKTKSGTITDFDPKDVTGYESKALYKLVDLQLGPDNSLGRDGRFIGAWSGIDSNRSGIMFYSGIIGIALLIIIGSLCIAKIEMTFELLLKIIFLPIIFLKGLLPNGHVQISEYVSEVFGIFMKRVFIVLILTITLNICIAIGHSSANYNVIGIFTLAFLIAIMLYWKEIVNIINNSAVQIGNMRKKANIAQYMPKDLALKYNTLKARVSTAIPGAIGGAIGAVSEKRAMEKAGLKIEGSALLQGAKYGAGRMFNRNAKMISNKQRKDGFGIMKQFTIAKEAGATKTIANMLLKPTNQQRYDVKQVYNVINNKVVEYEAYRDSLLQDVNSPDDLTGAKLEKYNALNMKIDQANRTLAYLHNATGDDWESTAKWNSSGNRDIDKIILSVKMGRKILVNKYNNAILDDKVIISPEDELNNGNYITKTLSLSEEAEYLIQRINNVENKKENQENNTTENNNKDNTNNFNDKRKRKTEKLKDTLNSDPDSVNEDITDQDIFHNKKNGKTNSFNDKIKRSQDALKDALNSVSEPVKEVHKDIKDLVNELNNSVEDSIYDIKEDLGLNKKAKERFEVDKEVYSTLKYAEKQDDLKMTPQQLKAFGAGSTSASQLKTALENDNNINTMSAFVNDNSTDDLTDKKFEDYRKFAKANQLDKKKKSDSSKIKVVYTEEKKDQIKKEFLENYSPKESAKQARENAYKKATQERTDKIRSKIKDLMKSGVDLEFDNTSDSYKVVKDKQNNNRILTTDDYKKERNDPVIDDILSEINDTNYKTQKEQNKIKNKIKNRFKKGGKN